MKHDIRMDYVRLGDKYAGEIYVQIQPTRGFLLWKEVSEVKFVQLMTKLANCIRAHADVESVCLSRKEVKNSSYYLDQETIKLFIKDPAAAIKSMSQPDRVVHVRDKAPALLRAGTKTLADAFGEEIYIRQRGPSRTSSECPFCGRWWLFRSLVAEGEDSDRLFKFTCESCSISIGGVVRSASWVAIQVQDLLNTAQPRFFLPRAWNTSGSWITRSELEAKLKRYIKEKNECLEDLKA